MANPRTPDPIEPAFWFGFEVAWAKVALGRVVLFGLLALDALLQLRHAPRYGAGGFNVGQLPGLDALGPTRALYAVAELINGYLFVLAAFGVATRIAIPIAAASYAWLYFGSQLDSYQHHYLVSLVLLIACFVPWQRPPDATPTTAVRSWALRLLLVQLAIMYLWAAVSKLNGAWLDGRTLSTQIHGPVQSLIDGTVGMKTASRMVVAIELALAGTVWLRPAWRIAAPLGILLHAGIVLSGLEIGLFAWLMLALYVFIVPDVVWTWLAELAPMRALRGVARAIGRRLGGGARWTVWLVAVAGGLAFAAACRFDHAMGVAVVVTVGAFAIAGAAALGRGPRLAAFAAAHLAALALWVIVDRASTVAADYYKFWGGTSRRLGDRDTAEQAYRRLTEVAPDDPTGHFQLGRLLLGHGAVDAGLAELHDAERLERHRARAFVAEARWLGSHGRRDEAIAKAREAIAAESSDADARGLLDTLTGAAPIAPGSHIDPP